MKAKKTVTIQLTDEQHKAAKIAAAHAGMTFKEIFLAGIRRLEDDRQTVRISDPGKRNE